MELRGRLGRDAITSSIACWHCRTQSGNTAKGAWGCQCSSDMRGALTRRRHKQALRAGMEAQVEDPGIVACTCRMELAGVGVSHLTSSCAQLPNVMEQRRSVAKQQANQGTHHILEGCARWQSCRRRCPPCWCGTCRCSIWKWNGQDHLLTMNGRPGVARLQPALGSLPLALQLQGTNRSRKVLVTLLC